MRRFALVNWALYGVTLACVAAFGADAALVFVGVTAGLLLCARLIAKATG